MDVAVDLIGPAGFDMTDRALRRAALDYLGHVSINRHESFTVFVAARRKQLSESQMPGRLILLSSHAATPHVDFAFTADDTLLLGRESAGCPQEVHDAADARIKIPMRPDLRSLNVAVAAAIVLGEALRQTNAYPRT